MENNMMTSVFFAPEGEKGLNETSAQKLAAIAASVKLQNEKFLSNLSFVDCEVAIIGCQDKLVTSKGCSKEMLFSIIEKAKYVAFLNGFIAYLAEARKDLEKLRKDIRNIDFIEWYESNFGKCPDAPKSPVKGILWDIESAIKAMNIKDRTEYLALEAKSSVLGKLIHPSGALIDAYDELCDRASKSTEVQGSGRETIVRYYTPSVFIDDAKSQFDSLQKEYQNTESSLNQMKSRLRMEVDAHNDQVNSEYRLACEEYRKQCKEYANNRDVYISMFEDYIREETAKASKIKIAIPKKYEELIQQLYNLGK